jgi:hypothetical protein
MFLHLMLLSLPLLLFAALATAGESPLLAPSALRAWLRDSVHPIVGLAVVLTSIGLPFFMLSSSAPLMQRWYCEQAPSQRRIRTSFIQPVISAA